MGFKEALAGVYSLLASPDLYVRELRFGLLGALAQEWTDIVPVSAYQAELQYDFEATNPTRRINAIWGGMYNAIANVNVIIEVIDDRRDIFSSPNFEVIKGEALALRAFMHFDLLRMFGASFAVNPSGDRWAIPYVTRYTSLIFPQLTIGEVMEKILEDFELAARYLREWDPISNHYIGREITQQVDNGYLLNRSLRLNYYAVRGMQARAHLWRGSHVHGDFQKAAEFSEYVINSGRFRWTTGTEMNGADFSGASEQLWGLNVTHQNRIVRNHFENTPDAGDPRTGPAFIISDADREVYFENHTADYRYLFLFRLGNQANQWFLRKFDAPAATAPIINRNRMSMIKLAEMYYILAETQRELGGDYLATFNAVRRARNVPVLTEILDFENTLFLEKRKEFLGEGQLWFFFKRKNRQHIPRTSLDLIALNAYIFPLPDAEFEGAPRHPNR